MSGLEVTFWGLGASRLEVFTEEDDNLVQVLRGAGYVAVPTDRSPTAARTPPRIRLVKVCPRHGDRHRCSFASFPHDSGDTRVVPKPRGKRIVKKDEQAPGKSPGAYPARPQPREIERALESAHDVH